MFKREIIYFACFIISDILPKYLEYKQKYGEILRLFIGHEAYVVASGQKYVEHVLSSPTIINKSSLYRFFHTWLGKGLFTANGEWKMISKVCHSM